MNINSLPDVVLRHIFSRLSLLDQFHLHHICPRWKSLQPSVTSTRKCLTLFIGELTDPSPNSLMLESSLTIPHLDQIESDLIQSKSILEFSDLNLGLTTHLVSLFPNINSLCLVLNQTGHETVDQVIHLLESWHENLESLLFYCHFAALSNYNFIESSKQLLKMIHFIDEHCLALDCLTFDVHEQLYKMFRGRPANELDLPCLARLRKFKFFSLDNAAILFGSLKKYGAGDRLKSISLGNIKFDEVGDVMTEFAQHPHITAKFISLPNISFYLVPREPPLFGTFNSLTSLKFELVKDMTLSEFSLYLAPLHNLLYLYLSIFPKELSQYDATPTYEFARLPSVKILGLMLLNRSHTGLASRHWSTIFPSIQFVEISTLNEVCELCSPIHEGIAVMQLNPEPSIDASIEQDKKNQCWKRLLGTLKQFNQLKKIVATNYYPRTVPGAYRKEWTVEELN